MNGPFSGISGMHISSLDSDSLPPELKAKIFGILSRMTGGDAAETIIRARKLERFQALHSAQHAYGSIIEQLNETIPALQLAMVAGGIDTSIAIHHLQDVRHEAMYRLEKHEIDASKEIDGIGPLDNEL